MHPSTQKNLAPTKVLRLPKVLEKIGISRSQLYRLINQGDFPKQYHLSVRTAVWAEAEIEAWLHKKMQGASHAV